MLLANLRRNGKTGKGKRNSCHCVVFTGAEKRSETRVSFALLVFTEIRSCAPVPLASFCFCASRHRRQRRGDFWFLVSPQVSLSPPSSARAGCAASGPLALLAYRRPAVTAAVRVATRQEISQAAGQDIRASARRYVTRSSQRAASQQATAP